MFIPNNAVMQFPVPGMPASRWQGSTSLWLVFMPARRWQGSTSLWLVFYASETLAYLSGETPKFRMLEFYCIIWVCKMGIGWDRCGLAFQAER